MFVIGRDNNSVTLVVAAAIGYTVIASCAYLSNVCRIPWTVQLIESSSTQTAMQMAIPRASVVETITNAISPEEGRFGYGIIGGSHGVGKTSTVLCAAKDLGSGVLYFEVPAAVEDRFAQHLGDTIRFQYDEKTAIVDRLLHFFNIATLSGQFMLMLCAPDEFFFS